MPILPALVSQFGVSVQQSSGAGALWELPDAVATTVFAPFLAPGPFTLTPVVSSISEIGDVNYDIDVYFAPVGAATTAGHSYAYGQTLTIAAAAHITAGGAVTCAAARAGDVCLVVLTRNGAAGGDTLADTLILRLFRVDI